MSQLYLFRHGQTEFNLHKIFTGWLNSKLTTQGVQQAQKLGELLKDKQIDLAYQTRLARSQDTLKEVLKFHPECRTVLIDDRMIERSYGDLEGETHQSVIDRYGQQQFNLWHRDYHTPPPGGESFAMVEKRVQSFINDLKQQYAGKDLGIAISAHGNSIRVFRKIMEQKPINEVVSWNIPYDEYFTYEL